MTHVPYDHERDRVEAQATKLFGEVDLVDQEFHRGWKPGQPKKTIEYFRGFAGSYVIGEGDTWQSALDDAIRNRSKER